MTTRKKSSSEVPTGWDEARVRRVASHYDGQTEGEAVAEAEAALARQTVMDVPRDIVPQVRVLIAKHQRARERAKAGLRRTARG